MRSTSYTDGCHINRAAIDRSSRISRRVRRYRRLIDEHSFGVAEHNARIGFERSNTALQVCWREYVVVRHPFEICTARQREYPIIVWRCANILSIAEVADTRVFSGIFTVHVAHSIA